MAGEQTVVSSDAAFAVVHDSSAYDECTYKCAGLGAAETVVVKVQVGSAGYQVAYQYDPAGATNNAIAFTGSGGTPPNVSQMVLRGDNYEFSTTDPAAVVTVSAKPGRLNTQ